jgi:hypothetical protein
VSGLVFGWLRSSYRFFEGVPDTRRGHHELRWELIRIFIAVGGIKTPVLPPRIPWPGSVDPA